MMIALGLPSNWNIPPNWNWNYTNAPSALSSPGELRYRQTTQDSSGRALELRPEQQACFAKHYPVGNMIPFSKTGATFQEIEEKVNDYCIIMKLNVPHGLIEILDEMVQVGIVERIMAT